MIYKIFLLSTLIWCVSARLSESGKLPAVRLCRLQIYPVLAFAALLMAFRSISVGMDTQNYYIIFKSFCHCPIEKIFYERYEPLWFLMAWGVGHLSESFLLFQLIFSTIFCLLAGRFLSVATDVYKIEYTITPLIVLITTVYLLTFNISRQMMAVMFMMNGVACYMKRQLVGVILFAVGAVGFHYTAVLGLPMLLIWHFRNAPWLRWVSLALLASIYFGFPYLWLRLVQLGVWEKYLMNGFGDFQQTGLTKVVWLVVGIHAIYIIMRRRVFTGKDVFVAICCLIWILTNLLAPSLNYMERVGLYYVPMVALIYPVVGQTFRNSALRIVYFICVTGAYAVWFLMSASSGQYDYALCFE